MVLKHGKLGIRNGNTVRYNCLEDKKSMGFIKKHLLNNDTGTELNYWKYFDDGELPATRSPELWFSLNKKKRWMLVDTLKSVVDDENLADEKYRAVLYERVLSGFITGDCIGYHDSKLNDQDVNCKHRYPRNRTFGFLTDLRLADQDRIYNIEYNSEKSNAKKKKSHRHFRGVQRNLLENNRIAEHQNNRQWNQIHQRRGGVIDGFPDDREPNIPELRYEVCYSPLPIAKSLIYGSKQLKSRPCNLPNLYPGTRQAMYGHHGLGKLKSLTKTKGKRDKPWADEYYRGACAKTIQECIKHRHELSLNCVRQNENKYVGSYSIRLCEESFFSGEFTDFDDDDDDDDDDENMNRDVEDYIWDFNKTEGYFIDFAYLIKPKVSKKRRKSKKKTKQKIENIHPNVAMGTNSQFYGKDKVIYTVGPENSTFSMEESTSDEEDFEDLVNHQADVDEFTSIDGQILEESYLSCNISSDSIIFYLQNGLCNKNIRFSQCKPVRYIIQLSGETTLLDSHASCYLLLWERSSADSYPAYKEYSLRVHDNRHNPTDLHRLFQHTIDSKSSDVFTLNELISMSENVINQLYSTAKTDSFNKMKVQWSDFITLENDLDLAMRLNGSQIDVKSIQEVHSELVEEKGDKSPEDTMTSFDVISVDELNFGVEDIPDYCDICVIPFTDVTMEMTTLLPCQHIFCNQCWMTYIIERIRQGDDVIPCLSYSCKEVIDDVTIMSFVTSRMFENWKRRKQESLVEKSGKWKWCPNNSCTYLARTNTGTTDIVRSSVQCKCDNNWCLDCQQPDHWPASCEQITVYRKMLEQNGDESGKKMTPTKSYFAHVKKCPNCHHPMEKDGGCSHMTCKCKHHFCWECLEDWNYHVTNGLHCTKKVEEITMELDSEIFHPLPLKFYKRSVSHRYKWKSLGRGNIRRKVYQHEANRKARHYTPKRRAGLEIPNYFTPNKELIQYYIFIKQAHQVLENMLIVLSNLTRKNRNREIELLVLQAEFCIYRQEQILEKNKLSEEDLRRINRLNLSTWDCLRKLAVRMPKLQATITKSKQKILGKPLSLFEQYK